MNLIFMRTGQLLFVWVILVKSSFGGPSVQILIRQTKLKPMGNIWRNGPQCSDGPRNKYDPDITDRITNEKYTENGNFSHWLIIVPNVDPVFSATQ